MSTTAKILIFVGMIITLGALGIVLYNQHQLATQQTAIQTEQLAQRQLIDGVVRAQTSWATQADVASLLAANGVNAAALAAIQADMSSVKANLTTANVVTVNSQAQNTTGQASTGTGLSNPNPLAPTVNGCPNPDPNGFMAKEQDFALNEDFGNLKVPFGTVGFSAWQPNPWSTNIAARQYTIDNVIGTDENQRNVVYNQVNIKEGANTYTIPVTSSVTKQVYPTAKFSVWNPRLLLSMDGGVNVNHVRGDFVPNIGIGIMSWGQYKTTPDWSILELGAGYSAVNKTPGLVITPVAYNVGRNLFSPLMNNTYIGPSVTINTDGSFGIGAGLKVGF